MCLVVLVRLICALRRFEVSTLSADLTYLGDRNFTAPGICIRHSGSDRLLAQLAMTGVHLLTLFSLGCLVYVPQAGTSIRLRRTAPDAPRDYEEAPETFDDYHKADEAGQ